MADRNFCFALEFSSRGVSASLLDDLSSHVRRDLQFRARDGRLDILLCSDSGRIFQTARSLA